MLFSTLKIRNMVSVNSVSKLPHRFCVNVIELTREDIAATDAKIKQF